MLERITDTKIARQTELAIGQIDSLSTLPCVAERFLSNLSNSQSSALAEIIEPDPALTAKILSLISKQGVSIADENFSLRQVLDKLPSHLIRNAFFSVKVEQSFGQDDDKIIFREQLLLHCLAVACCAKEIAEIVSPKINSNLAYLAGLLHNIGNLALEQAMPKSFSKIVEEAKSQNAAICEIEQKHLGCDYTILGKRLAQKWRFPNEITLAIWLHNSEATAISESMPEAKVAQIVQLANLIARQCSIGQSGSYDSLDSEEPLVRSFAINTEQLQQIRQNLGEQVAQKSKVLGLDSPKPQTSYYNIIRAAASQLAHNNTKLSLENRKLQITSSHFDFITESLLSTNPEMAPIEVAENFATRWQKFYKTGPVCIYLTTPSDSQIIEAAVVDNTHKSKMVFLKAPTYSPAIPQTPQSDCAILNAQDYVYWLFEQLDVDFDLSQTKLAPLLSNGKAIGAIVFELRQPVNSEQLPERFRSAVSTTGAILDIAFCSANQQRLAEQFARLPAKLKDSQYQLDSNRTFNTLVEIAAGVAHELNNPLSVISGRVQLLGETETDREKKRILKQIQENTNELSAIIDELMSFARPEQPKPSQTNIKTLIDEAIQLAARKTNAENPDIQIYTHEANSVFVDSAQIVSAIANVLANAIESYDDRPGAVKVAAVKDKSGDFVKLTISDRGCGMDTQTLQKATQPFFCSRPAGRKRGMGLAYAKRMIQLNNGSLNITSQPGSGTTLTIYLPCK